MTIVHVHFVKYKFPKSHTHLHAMFSNVCKLCEKDALQTRTLPSHNKNLDLDTDKSTGLNIQ